MIYAEKQAREQVVRAGLRLVESGLIARTWGNISARISQTQFVITPSGLAYETLEPEQLVVVNIADCSHEGEGKPSSEKGIHADAYRLRPDVGFVIHTHQSNATLASLSGTVLPVDEDLRDRLGALVPCAAYGMPSTKKLRRAVAAVMTAYPDSPAVLLRHHGALCLGGSFEEAFAVADALEIQCGRVLDLTEAAPDGSCPDFGESVRDGDGFSLVCNGTLTHYSLSAPTGSLPRAAALHAAIYRHFSVSRVFYDTDADVVAYSALGLPLPPLLDDVVQMAGAGVDCVTARPDRVVRALRGRSAVLLQGAGALCLAENDDDRDALKLLLRKGCLAARYAKTLPECRPLGRMDAAIQRAVYVNKYAKRKG